MVLFPGIAYILVVILKIPYVPATILFFAPPALYLSIKKPQIIAKSALFTLLIALTLSWGIDYMIFLDGSWYVPSNFRILNGTVPVADILWFSLWAYFGIVFWEYFIDHDRNKHKVSPNIRYLLIILGVWTVIFTSLYLLKSPLLVWKYFYLKMGTLLFIPMLIFTAFKFPRVIRKMTILFIYFLVISVLVEHAALLNGHWTFPGPNFIGTVLLAQELVPYEEIVFWWILGMPGIICWYEIFADDRK